MALADFLPTTNRNKKFFGRIDPLPFGTSNQQVLGGASAPPPPGNRPTRPDILSSLVEKGPEDSLIFQNFTPAQKEVLNQLLSLGIGGIGQGISGFGPIEQHARTQFAQQTIPTIAERFTSMGGQRGGAFQQALGQAGAGLEESLAALRSQFDLQRQGQLQSLLSLGLTPQFETLYKGEKPGFFKSAAGPLLQGLGTILPLLLLGRR